ncbi:hypothetical protein [Citrobacter europaeus]|uniref:hypothetical protein n=1 Tax=Citrobacter europaeus TaxID=1914243 RepID=UPI00397A9EA0
MQFTKEQLITHITRHSDEINRLIKQQSHHDNEYRKKLLAVNEIALAALTAEPVAWTDEQELRDVEKDGCGYLFKVNPISPNADHRCVIKLFRLPEIK